jgi:hypothetical protein
VIRDGAKDSQTYNFEENTINFKLWKMGENLKCPGFSKCGSKFPNKTFMKINETHPIHSKQFTQHKKYQKVSSKSFHQN